MKVMIIWESTRGRTKAMAEAICEGVTSAGGEGILVDAKEFSGIGDACAVALGSSTRMKKVLPMVKRALSQLPSLNGIAGAAFGSYGWSGEAPDEIAGKLSELGADLVIENPIKAKDFPSQTILDECRVLGNKLIENCKK
ncbi:MAG: flavodoxin domain-containing protein [Candidatus Thorarchaeota archaeon]|jgi:flavorubredoxin